MNPVTSYLRHLIVAGILLFLAKYKLPLDGADAFADGVALFAIGSVTWLIVKYAPLSIQKLLGLAVIGLCAGTLVSCQGLSLGLTSKYGTVNAAPDGSVTFAPRPIFIRADK
ncbi:MAG: hypothetical protein ABIS50_15190 [Luteolibacter sp.]|uniref:hypothetical protein n=1 Tax=Luteolibacter sp. TaxID=1962973 RepID=UPI0032672396